MKQLLLVDLTDGVSPWLLAGKLAAVLLLHQVPVTLTRLGLVVMLVIVLELNQMIKFSHPAFILLLFLFR